MEGSYSSVWEKRIVLNIILKKKSFIFSDVSFYYRNLEKENKLN